MKIRVTESKWGFLGQMTVKLETGFVATEFEMSVEEVESLVFQCEIVLREIRSKENETSLREGNKAAG